MQALWMSLRDKVNCRSKLNIMWSEQHRKTSKPEKETLDRKFICHMRNSFREVIIGQYNLRTQLCELNIGDPARNIMEIIFQRATANPSKPSRKITRVLRVKNSIEIIERFERYREEAKRNAYGQHKRHPRSSVDGNELLRFYGTTMSCSSRKLRRVFELCRDPSCHVCIILQSNFDTEFTRRNGIRLSTSSEEISDDGSASTMAKKMERAVIVCRTIAGMNVKMEEVNEGSDPMRSKGENCKAESLIMKNPSAVLPCFVVVFS